jgi:hypothetical protein
MTNVILLLRLNDVLTFKKKVNSFLHSVTIVDFIKCLKFIENDSTLAGILKHDLLFSISNYFRSVKFT